MADIFRVLRFLLKGLDMSGRAKRVPKQPERADTFGLWRMVTKVSRVTIGFLVTTRGRFPQPIAYVGPDNLDSAILIHTHHDAWKHCRRPWQKLIGLALLPLDRFGRRMMRGQTQWAEYLPPEPSLPDGAFRQCLIPFEAMMQAMSAEAYGNTKFGSTKKEAKASSPRPFRAEKKPQIGPFITPKLGSSKGEKTEAIAA